VQLLLDAGIDVLTTMNIQHLESLNDQVWNITGIRVRETIPDWVVQQADEVVMMDLTPQALLNRLERGVVYAREKAEQARKNFFREQILVALRELALRQAAHEVEQRIDSGLYKALSPRSVASDGKRHKIAVLVTPDPQTVMSIRRAKRVSDFLGAECFAIAVNSAESIAQPEREALEEHLNFARNLHIETRVLEGGNIASVVVDFARRNGVTQIFVVRSEEPRGPLGLLRGDLVQQIVSLARDMQIVIVSSPEPVSQR
jgi:two-component system sensor histidine kinase KdpD